MKQELYKKLEQYQKEDVYPFHMPGHKRNAAFAPHEGSSFSMDITEIDGFDNLHHPEGLIKEAQDRAALLFQVKESFFSVNGSTAALLSALYASCSQGGRLLMARNCHKAVYHGAYLRGLKTSYLYPETEEKYGLNGGISPEAVRAALKEKPDTQAVIITSPTYDGVVSDVKAIAEAVHEAGCILIVDEAHGPHLKFHPYFPGSAVAGDADLIIHSLHKTLPSMTQTALLHRNSDRVSHERLQYYMGIFQTSSPSYVLMTSMDACVCRMFREGTRDFEAYVGRLQSVREKLQDMKQIRLVGREIVGTSDIYDFDRSKLVFSVKGRAVGGPRLSGILRDRYGIELEMEALDYVLALTSVADTQEGFDRLVHAMMEIDESLSGAEEVSCEGEALTGKFGPMEQVMTIDRGMDSPKTRCAIALSPGKISGEFVYLYPPGIPLLVPGERIDADCVEKIFAYQREGLQVQGLSDYQGQSICVTEDES
ncbi:MAG: aminotransferase class I/II-fold pyridoxal phosphate-dependent enzyme [Blautia sp.]|jgi:arginine decarboxylase